MAHDADTAQPAVGGSFRWKQELPVLVLLLIPFLTLPFVWDRVPDTVPIHWGMDGEPDRFAGRTTGMLLIPLIGVSVYLLFWLIPVIDPKRRVALYRKPLPALRFLLVLVSTFLFFVTLGSVLEIGGLSGTQSLLHLGILLLFLALGNYMPAIQPNYFIGIRTPWTLEDPDIWRQTHRVGGRIWVICSIGLIAAWAVLPQAHFSRVMLVVVLGAMVALPILYSLWLHLRHKRSPRAEP